MAKRTKAGAPAGAPARMFREALPFFETQAIYCGDNIDKLRELPDACVDLIYIDPPFNSNRDYEVYKTKI